MSAEADRLLRLSEVSRLLGLSRTSTHELLSSGRLTHVKIPGTGSRFHRRVRLSVVNALIESCTVGGQSK